MPACLCSTVDSAQPVSGGTHAETTVVRVSAGTGLPVPVSTQHRRLTNGPSTGEALV